MTKEDVIKEINQVLKKVEKNGCDYYDGASEVMNVQLVVDKIVDKYKTSKKIAKFLEEVYKEDERKTEPFVFDAVNDLIKRKFNDSQKEEFINLEFVKEFKENQNLDEVFTL